MTAEEREVTTPTDLKAVTIRGFVAHKEQIWPREAQSQEVSVVDEDKPGRTAGGEKEC
jgi:hypothetical protein